MSIAIKQEPNDSIKSEPSERERVKREPGTASDDDDYEDAGDLDMAHGKRGLWLIKLPKFLLEQWDKIDDDEEIILGQLFVSSEEKVSLYGIIGVVACVGGTGETDKGLCGAGRLVSA